MKEYIPSLSISAWYVTFAYSPYCNLHPKKYLKKVVEFFSMLLFITKGNNWKMFYVGFWYTTMNATLIIYFLPVMHIYGRHISCCSIISLLLPFGIKSMLIIWSLSSSTIIIGDTWWITRMTITFLRDFNILAKWWKLFIICRSGTNNFNLIVFQWNFFILITLIVIVWCIITYEFILVVVFGHP